MTNVIDMKETTQFIRRELANETTKRNMTPRIINKINKMSQEDLKLLANKMQWLSGRS